MNLFIRNYTIFPCMHLEKGGQTSVIEGQNHVTFSDDILVSTNAFKWLMTPILFRDRGAFLG